MASAEKLGKSERLDRLGALYVMGDVHGQLDKLVPHLREAGLVRGDLGWSGGASRLWFMGDFFDRGPAAIEVVDLIVSLQEEAPKDGGEVGALVGNHEALILAAREFRHDPEMGPYFLECWLVNGGDETDLRRLTNDRVRWLTELPAVALVQDKLLVHADSDFYLSYGRDIASINSGIKNVLESHDPPSWENLLNQFSDRHVFDQVRPGGEDRVRHMLQTLGGDQLIHGHTPIDKVTRQRPAEVRGPVVYGEGLAVNVDGGMYRGGPGFLYRVP